MQHLAFVRPQVISAIINGYKTVECRLSIRPRHPAHTTQPGDEILFKAVGGDVEAYALVERVDHYSDLRSVDLPALAGLYAKTAFTIPGMDIEKYLDSKRDARFATFIWLTDLAALHIPKSSLPTSRLGWIAPYPA